MAKLPSLPAQGVVDKLAGTLDFYVQHLNPSDERGITCVRTWPRYDPESYPESSKVMQPTFCYINTIASQLPENIIDAYKDLAGGTGLNWKDFLIRLYLNKDAL